MTAPLASLLLPLTKEQIRQRILSGLQLAGLPTSDWAPTAQGGIENGVIDMADRTIVDLVAAKLAAGIAGGFLDFAKGDWLTFWAWFFFGLERNLASSTIQAITLKCAPSAGPYTVEPGDLLVIGTGTIDGANRYRNIEGGTVLPGAGSFVGPAAMVLQFQAENPGSAYDDVPGSVQTLVTSLPGVTAINERVFTPNPAAIVSGGGSRGQIFFSQTTPGVPPSQDRFRIQIVASGQGQTSPLMQFRFSTDDGRTWSFPATTVGFYDIPGGCRVTFQDSPLTSPSFVAGDVFFSGNTSILQQGSDAESDERLIARCRARFLTLSDVPSSGTVALWARLADPTVARVRVLADLTVANRMLVYVGGSSGRAAPATVVAVQAYITARLDPSEAANVLSVDTRAVAPTGSVTVPRLQLAAIQTRAEQLWTDYLASVDIGGTVRLAELEQAVMDAGATDYTGLALTGGGPNIVLGNNEVAVPPDGSTLVNALSWEPI